MVRIIPEDKRIQVFLIATGNYNAFSEGCRLKKLAQIFNRRQRVFYFISIPNKSMGASSELNIIRTLNLPNISVHPESPYNAVSTAQTLSSYISDIDAYSQIVNFFKNTVYGPTYSNSSNNLIYAITSDIIVPDLFASKKYDRKNEFYGSVADDSFSCLSGIDSMDDENNNHPKSLNNVGVVSLVRYPIVFLESLSVFANRAMVSRYITSNLAHLLAGRLFGKSLAREHTASCIAETNWQGGEKRSYFSDGLCRSCQNLAKQYGPARKYAIFSSVEVIDAINQISSTSRVVESWMEQRQVQKRIFSFSVIGLAVSLFSNLLAGFESSDDIRLYRGFSDYLLKHGLASSLVCASLIVALVFLLRLWLIERKLP